MGNLHRLPCLVMELLHSDLTNFLTNNPKISCGMKLSILHDVALGLRFLHNSNPPIIHRDLSSNNILISRRYVAKIGDLGTARFLNPSQEKQLSRMSKLTKAPGTVDFMSPEVLFDNPKYGAPLDVIFGGDYIKGCGNKQFTWQAVPYIYMFHSETRQWEKVGKIPTSYYLGRCVNLTASKIFFIFFKIFKWITSDKSIKC